MADFELQQIDSLLLTLQDVLRDKFALESEIEALPLNLSTQKEELAEANRKYLELNEKYNKAKEEAARIMDHARVEAQLEKQKLSDEVKQEIISVASLMAGKMVALSMDDAAQEKLLNETLQEMGEKTWLN